MTFAGVRGRLVVEVFLPVSKADQEARGAARSHACLCLGGQRRVDCPAHAALLHLRVLREHFPERFLRGPPDADLPFFAQPSGEAPSKKGFVETIQRAAREQGIPLIS